MYWLAIRFVCVTAITNERSVCSLLAAARDVRLVTTTVHTPAGSATAAVSNAARTGRDLRQLFWAQRRHQGSLGRCSDERRRGGGALACVFAFAKTNKKHAGFLLLQNLIVLYSLKTV